MRGSYRQELLVQCTLEVDLRQPLQEPIQRHLARLRCPLVARLHLRLQSQGLAHWSQSCALVPDQILSNVSALLILSGKTCASLTVSHKVNAKCQVLWSHIIGTILAGKGSRFSKTRWRAYR